MSIINVDPKTYIVLKHIENEQYYAVLKPIWKSSEEAASNLRKLQKKELILVEVFRLQKDEETDTYNLTPTKEQIDYDKLTGLLIQYIS